MTFGRNCFELSWWHGVMVIYCVWWVTVCDISVLSKPDSVDSVFCPLQDGKMNISCWQTGDGELSYRSCKFRLIWSSGWSAWSKVWHPPRTHVTFIWWTGQTLTVALPWWQHCEHYHYCHSLLLLLLLSIAIVLMSLVSRVYSTSKTFLK